MATDTIARMLMSVKQEADTSAELSQELIEREQFFNEDMVLAPSIFRGNLTKARDLMNAVGDAVFVPHTNYTTLNVIADFYGVRAEYLKNLFVKHGIVYKKMPADVLRISCNKVLDTMKQFDDVYVKCECLDSYHRYYSFSQKPLCDSTKVVIPWKGCPCFYSSRVFLASASLMHYGAVIPKDSKASKVMDVLRRSSYYIQAKEAVAKNKRKEEERRKEDNLKKHSSSGSVKVASSGEFVILPEVFVQIIKATVKDAVLDTMSTFAAELPTGRREKC